MLTNVLRTIFEYLKNLNIYVVTNEDTDIKRRKKIYATRLFLILFIVSLVVLVGYTTSTFKSTTIHLNNPSQITFEQIYSTHRDNLVCPCTQKFIQIEKFIQVNVSYHQICSSIFTDNEWISSITPSIFQQYFSLDIRRIFSSQLQSLSSFCRLSQLIINNSLTNLKSNQFYLQNMLSRGSFESQIDIMINEILKNIKAERNQTQHLIQILNQQNQLTSAIQNYFLYFQQNPDGLKCYLSKYLKNQTYSPSFTYSNYPDSQLCSCVESSNCIYPSGVYPNLTGAHSYNYKGKIIPLTRSQIQLPGLYTGCLPFDSLIQSTLECFYRVDCLTAILNTSQVNILNSTQPSKYNLNATVRMLIDELFIESISIENDFQMIYDECQPNKCTYSFNSKGNLSYTLTTIISLFGGLFVGLNTLSLFLMNIILWLVENIKKKFSKTSSKIACNVKRISFMNKFKTKISQSIKTFNLFKDPFNDEHGRKNEIISTRIYILFMIISVIVIISYALITEHTLTYQVEPESIDEYRQLIIKYPSLTCECEHMATLYSKFISFNPIFHQLCSSIYVSDAFPVIYAVSSNAYTLSKFNLRIAVSSYYTAARTVCSLISDTSSSAIDTYLQTTYISQYLTHENEFLSRMNASIANFELLAPTTINNLIQLIRDLTQGNQLLTGSFTNAKPQSNSSTVNIQWMNPNNPSCNCGMTTNSCARDYDEFCNYTFIPYTNPAQTACFNSVPGLILSCYIVDGLLMSKASCFFEPQCVKYTIGQFAMSYWNTTLTDEILSLFLLNKNITSRFSINATSLEILQYLGIENWNENIDYTSYYKNCNPTHCFYTIRKHFHIPTIITIVISLIGGVSVILKILVPLIVDLIRRQSINTSRISVRRLVTKYREMNLFKTYETQQSPQIRHDQIITTRLYIIFWIFSLIFLSLYTSLSNQTVSQTIDKPTIADVRHLHSTNVDEFTCPCSKLTITYDKFTSINYTFHQICSSEFISQTWLASLFNFTNDQTMSRGVLSSHFQLVYSFCRISNTILFDAKDNFYASQFVSMNLLTENEFIQQTQIYIEQFQMKTISSHQQNLRMFLNIILANQFMSVYQTNWFFIPNPAESDAIYTKARTYQSGNCSCASPKSIDCADPLVVGERNTSVIGMKIGCLPLTSLRLSTLECFYNQTCVDEVKASFHLQNLSITALNSSHSSQYSMNTSLDHIIDNLFLEQSTENIDYIAYFDECNPQQCTYTHINQNYPLLIFTTLLGLYGGLTIALRLIVPVLIKIARKIIKHCSSTRTIEPQQTF